MRAAFAKHDDCAFRAGLSQRMTHRDGVSDVIVEPGRLLLRLSYRNCLTSSSFSVIESSRVGYWCYFNNAIFEDHSPR